MIRCGNCILTGKGQSFSSWVKRLPVSNIQGKQGSSKKKGNNLFETEQLRWALRQTASWPHSCKRQWFSPNGKGQEGKTLAELSRDGKHPADSENKPDLKAMLPAIGKQHSLGWFSFCYPLLTSHSDIPAFRQRISQKPYVHVRIRMIKEHNLLEASQGSEGNCDQERVNEFHR